MKGCIIVREKKEGEIYCKKKKKNCERVLFPCLFDCKEKYIYIYICTCSTSISTTTTCAFCY